MKNFYTGFKSGITDGAKIVFSPFKVIRDAKNGNDYEKKEYLSLSDRDKMSADWYKVGNDLRKAIKHYG